MSKSEATISVFDLHDHIRYDPATGRFWRRSDGSREWAREIFPGTPRMGSICGRQFYAPRVAYALMTGDWPTGCVGFRDRDPNNCRWSNLIYRPDKLARRYTRHETAACVIYDWGVHSWRYRLFGDEQEWLSPPYPANKAGFQLCARHAACLIDYLTKHGKEVSI